MNAAYSAWDVPAHLRNVWIQYSLELKYRDLLDDTVSNLREHWDRMSPEELDIYLDRVTTNAQIASQQRAMASSDTLYNAGLSDDRNSAGWIDNVTRALENCWPEGIPEEELSEDVM